MVKGDAPDAEFESAETTGGLEMTLNDQTPGATLFIPVIPYNDAGDGGAGLVKSVVV